MLAHGLATEQLVGCLEGILLAHDRQTLGG
jgi:hypothetical protein